MPRLLLSNLRPWKGQGSITGALVCRRAGYAIPLLEKAAGACALPPPPLAVVIADYGAAAGHNSMLPMGVAIAALRKRTDAARDVSVIHTDVPANDFAGLFSALENDPDSYRRGAPAVYSSAVGHSFYDQILPRESVSLGSELVLHDTLALRAGWQEILLQDSELGPTAGFGVRGALGERRFHLDYAWADQGRLQDTHRFSLGILF